MLKKKRSPDSTKPSDISASLLNDHLHQLNRDIMKLAVEECIRVESKTRLCAGTAGNVLMFSHLTAGSADCVNREQAQAPSITRLQ